MEKNSKKSYLTLLVIILFVLATVTQLFFVKVDPITALSSLFPMLIGLYLLPIIILLVKFIKNSSVRRILIIILILLYTASFFQLTTLFKKGDLFIEDSRIHTETFLIVSKDSPFAIINIRQKGSNSELALLNFNTKELSYLAESKPIVYSFKIFAPMGEKLLYMTISNDLVMYDTKTKDIQKLKTADELYSLSNAFKYKYNSSALPFMYAWVDSKSVVFTCANENEGRLQDRNNWAYCILNLDSNLINTTTSLPDIYIGEIGQYYKIKNGLQSYYTWGIDANDMQTAVSSPNGNESILVDYYLRGWDGSTAWKVIWSDNVGNKKDIYRGPIPTGVYWTNDNHVFVTLEGEIRKIK